MSHEPPSVTRLESRDAAPVGQAAAEALAAVERVADLLRAHGQMGQTVAPSTLAMLAEHLDGALLALRELKGNP
jgi:hypothetical protein